MSRTKKLLEADDPVLSVIFRFRLSEPIALMVVGIGVGTGVTITAWVETGLLYGTKPGAKLKMTRILLPSTSTPADVFGETFSVGDEYD